ncbi:hypothetical protein AB0E01_39405 [Nocardia vinacea]|uniref:hypothetical protein n=1 Tax=Nocardia vinacea TaxID=96468 RepID=UPI0033DF0132
MVYDEEYFTLPVSVVSLSAVDDFSRTATIPLASGSMFNGPLWDIRIYAKNGLVRSIGLRCEHIVTDGQGLRNWQSELLDLCAGREISSPTLQPIDRANRDAKRSTVWKASEVMPQAVVPQIVVPPIDVADSSKRYVLIRAYFDGILPLVDHAARVLAMSRAQLFLLIFSWLLSRFSGMPWVYFAVVLHNRSKDDRGIDCQMLPVGLATHVPSEGTIREVSDSIKHSVTAAYRRQRRFDADAQFGTQMSACADRGIGRPVPFMFNFQGGPNPGLEIATVDSPTPRLRFQHLDDADGAPQHNSVSIYLGPAIGNGRGDCMVEVNIDTAHIPVRTVNSMVDILPRVLARIVNSPALTIAELDGMLPAAFLRQDCGTATVRNLWVRLEVIQDMVDSCVGVKWSRLEIRNDEVVAVVELHPDWSSFDVHEMLLSRLADRTDVCAPHRYKLVNRREDSPLSMQVVAEWCPSQGWPQLTASTRGEVELCRSLENVHGAPFENLALTYSQAGGRLLLWPAVVETLRRQGLTGLTPAHVRKPLTLRHIARCLVHVSSDE